MPLSSAIAKAKTKSNLVLTICLLYSLCLNSLNDLKWKSETFVKLEKGRRMQINKFIFLVGLSPELCFFGHLANFAF